jgi:hypothetical protein
LSSSVAKLILLYTSPRLSVKKVITISTIYRMVWPRRLIRESCNYFYERFVGIRWITLL